MNYTSSEHPCVTELTIWQTTKVVAVSIILAITLPLLLCLHLDYLAFLALGPGGTPSTLAGFVKLKALSFFTIPNPYQHPPICDANNGAGYLKKIAARKGRRPETRGIAPQRQITEKANKVVFEKLTARIEALGLKSAGIVLSTSCIEKHCKALFISSSSKANEICHVHPSDGSLHMVIDPVDIKMIFEAGWGERHPLSRGGWFERFVPEDFVFIYAPRDEEEIEIIISIAQAAACHVANKTKETAKMEKAKDG